MTSGDFNKDGNPDIAAADGTTVQVLPGNGDGTFQPPLTTELDPRSGAGYRCFDRRRGFQRRRPSRHRGKCRNQRAQRHPDPAGKWGRHISFGPECCGQPRFGWSWRTSTPLMASRIFLVADENLPVSTGVQLLLGNGDGTFQPARTVLLAGGPNQDSLVTADFNQDGHPDFALALFPAGGVAGVSRETATAPGCHRRLLRLTRPRHRWQSPT